MIVELSVIAICTSNCNNVPKNIRINILYDITSFFLIEYSTYGRFWPVPRHANVVNLSAIVIDFGLVK